VSRASGRPRFKTCHQPTNSHLARKHRLYSPHRTERTTHTATLWSGSRAGCASDEKPSSSMHAAVAPCSCRRCVLPCAACLSRAPAVCARAAPACGHVCSYAAPAVCAHPALAYAHVCLRMCLLLPACVRMLLACPHCSHPPCFLARRGSCSRCSWGCT
jgi:hypothetical protein